MLIIQTVQHPCQQNSFNKTPSNEVLKMKEHRELNFFVAGVSEFSNVLYVFCYRTKCLFVSFFLSFFELWTGVHDTCLFDFHPFSE